MRILKVSLGLLLLFVGLTVSVLAILARLRGTSAYAAHTDLLLGTLLGILPALGGAVLLVSALSPDLAPRPLLALRWVLVLPASFGVYMAVVLLAIGSDHVFSFAPVWAPRLSALVGAPVAALLFVLVGVRVAPSARPLVALALATLTSAMTATALLRDLIAGTHSSPLWWHLPVQAVTVGGALLGLRITRGLTPACSGLATLAADARR